jgi:16S rRNA (guanine527-N7)-methyltransferase
MRPADPLPSFRDTLTAEAQRLGLSLPPDSALPALETHFRTLLAWNRRMNLTAERDEALAVRRHPAEALAALPWLPDSPTHLLDLGSGTGYPALVLAACRPVMRATLVEASQRKAAFLRAVARDAGLDRIEVLRRRLEPGPELAGLPPFDLFTCRAVRAAADWVRALAPHIVPGGRALLFLGESETDDVIKVGEQSPDLRIETCRLPTRDHAFLVIVDYPA